MPAIYFNPGCALSLYKPESAKRLLEYLNSAYGEVLPHNVCCRHEPQIRVGSTIINVCAGCDKRFRTMYPGIFTISLWEAINQLGTFPLPNYHGLRMSIHDACPVRDQPRVHVAVRALLSRMNIEIVETAARGMRSVCCGDSSYPELPLEEVHERMKQRADAMPCQDVAVYCISCVKAMHLGGKTPRHLVDLLFNEPTGTENSDTVLWHEQLDAYIAEH